MIFKTESDFLQDITSFKLSNIYLLYGSDETKKSELINLITQKIENSFDISFHQSSNIDINLFLNDLSTSPIFSPKKLVVLKDFEKLKKENIKIINKYLSSPNNSTVLIITYNEDLRKNEVEKIFSEYKLTAIEIMPPDQNEIISYIKNEFSKNKKNISEKSLNYIADTIINYSHLKNETEKMLSYLKNKQEISFEETISLISDLKEKNVYSIIDAILSKNTEKFKAIIEELINLNEQPLIILNAITLSLEKILKIRAIKNSHLEDYKTSISIGVYPRELQFNVLKIPENKLTKTIDWCLEIEKTLKSTHTQDPYLLLRNTAYIICEYLMKP